MRTARKAGSPDDTAELEAAQLEARMIGLKILELTGKTDKPPLPVYDKSSGAYRPPTFRDIVILLRATQSWAPVMIEQLKAMGIPAYADLNTGILSAATEVEVMMSLLKVDRQSATRYSARWCASFADLPFYRRRALAVIRIRQSENIVLRSC